MLHDSGVETHLVMSDQAVKNIGVETDYQVESVQRLASFNHDIDNLGASVASGSFMTDGMVIAPCTVKTLSGIAHSYGENLMIRAADVSLKERRRLVLVVRETPLHKGHLKLMMEAADHGAIILPPVPAFYHHPKTIDDLVITPSAKYSTCSTCPMRFLKGGKGQSRKLYDQGPPSAASSMASGHPLLEGQAVCDGRRRRRRFRVLLNRGARIVLGMPKGFYPGYDREISEVYRYKDGADCGSKGR